MAALDGFDQRGDLHEIRPGTGDDEEFHGRSNIRALSNFLDGIDDGFEGLFRGDFGKGFALAPGEVDSVLHVLNGFDQDEAAFGVELLVHRADGAAKDAVNGHTQRGGFAVHGAAAADDEVGMPDEIEAVENAIGDDGFAVLEPFGPLTTNEITLLPVPRQ